MYKHKRGALRVYHIVLVVWFTLLSKILFLSILIYLASIKLYQLESNLRKSVGLTSRSTSTNSTSNSTANFRTCKHVFFQFSLQEYLGEFGLRKQTPISQSARFRKRFKLLLIWLHFLADWITKSKRTIFSNWSKMSTNSQSVRFSQRF